MSYNLCKKVRDLEPYEPIKGNFRVRLDANESFFSLPQEVRNEIKDIVDRLEFNRYPDTVAEKAIRAFADYYGVDPENVTATNGSDEVLYLLASAMLQRGSRVVTVSPDFSMYEFYSYLSENQIITFQKDEKLEINVSDLIAFVNENKADMLIFSNPCNPTGRGISAADARRLVRECPDTLVIIDEAYMDFWDQSILAEAAGYDNLIVLKTASKAVGEAAVRLGLAVCNKTITNALRAVKSPYNVNTMTQEICACVYSHKEMLEENRKAIIKNTRTLYEDLIKLKQNYRLPFDIYEPCANFVFVKTENAEDIFKYLLSDGIAVRYFGRFSALRITAGSEEQNAELLKSLERYVIEKCLVGNR